MKPIQLVVLSFFLLAAMPSLAADLRITVLEKGTGDPVEGASVVLLNSGEDGLSDESGLTAFEAIDLPEQVKVLALGYEVWQGPLEDAQPLSIYLQPLSGEVEALLVQEDRLYQKGSKVVLSVEELKRAPGSGGDPLKVIESLPGVVVSNDMGGGLYVRGSDAGDNLVWVDRVPIGYLYHLGGIYSTISPNMIQDFNAFLGGFPVEYDDVLGGVLDVKLRSPRRDRLHQEYSFGTYQSSIFLEGPIGGADSKQGFFFSARRSYLDLIFSPDAFTSFIQGDEDDSPEDLQNEVVQVPVFSDLQALWEYRGDAGRFSANFFKARDEARFIINENKLIDPQSAGTAGFSAAYSSLAFNWERDWGGGLNHSMPLTFYQSDNHFQIGRDENGQPFFLDIKDEMVLYQPELSLSFESGHRWRIGSAFAQGKTPVTANITREPSEADIGDFTFTDREKFSVDQTYKGYAISPYSDYRHHWTERFNTTLGLRYTHQEIRGGNTLHGLQPRLHAEYQLRPGTYLTAAWGLYLQSPRGSELVEEAGNPRLNFTEAEHRVIGIKHELSDQWNLLLEAFHKPMFNLVTAIDENLPPDNFSNEGKGEAYGLDLLVKREFSQRKSGWLSYSYIRTTRTGRDGVRRRFSGDQPHTLALVWSQPMFSSVSRWDIGFRFRYHSGLPYDPVIGTGLSEDGSHIIAVYPDTKNSARLPDFYQLDLRFDRPVYYNTWKLNFYIDILNVLNTRNVNGYDYGNNLEKVANPDEEYGLPLFPTFGIEAEF